jgi:hypothetical protein
LDETRSAFDKIYSSDTWGLKTDEYASAKPGMETENSRNKRFSTLITDLIKLNHVKSVVEFGCGWWKYMANVDLTGVQYDGFDIVDTVIQDNRQKFPADNVRFHTVRDGIRMPKADMLISKDVLQHLPTADVQYYLNLFRTNFRFMLIGNDCIPDDNLNGDTGRGGYRALRLERPPFNYPNVVLQQWECLEFGTFIVKNFCLFQGEPEKGSPDGVILRST